MLLRLIGPIDTKSVKKVSKLLESDDTEHTIILCSEGGSDDAALAIVGIMEAMHARGDAITVNAFGHVESAAVAILAAGSHRTLARHSWVMVHQSSTEVDGSTTDIVKNAKQLVRAEKSWNRMLAYYTTVSAKQWGHLHSQTTYMTPDECLLAGLIDEIK